MAIKQIPFMNKFRSVYEQISKVHKNKNLILILFIFSFLIILAVSLYANSLISFSMQTMEYNIEHRLISESKRLANMVSAEELNKYRTVPDMELPEYNLLRQRLLNFSRDADVLYAYYIRPQENGMQYIIDNDFNEETRVGLDTPPFDPHPTPWILQVIKELQAVCSGLGNYTPGWEGLLSGYAPILDEYGNVTAIAGVDIEDEHILQAQRLVLILTVVQVIAVASIFVIGIIYLSYLYRQIKTTQKLKEEADEANRTKSNFLASMSHEIRTPMNAITGMAELLLRDELSDKSRVKVQDIKQAGNNLISIINDILDFSKIEAGKLEIIHAKYYFQSLINDTVNITYMRIGEKPLQFFTNIDTNIPNCLIGDEVRLRQILLNLLSNAVKYSDKGHIGLTITVDKREDKQVWLKIAVTDTGKGIKPEDQAKLFDEFVQVDIKKNQGIEGTGLGLAITKRLCFAMGGNIAVESEYGKGSTFTVLIPQDIALDTPFANALDGNIDGKNYSFPNVRLLVVDDIPTNLKVAEGLLAPYKAAVDTCPSGLQAIELIKRNNYDIVFMDHMMPEMDGVETTAAIRALEGERFKTMPIIALTANAVVGMREMFIQNGFSDFLTKPIDIGKLDEILVRWIPKEKRESRSSEKKLLILVDGNPANLRQGKNILSEKYRVATSPSAAKLLELLKNNKPALILMDINIGGYEAIKDIPVIFLSENSADKEKCLGLGAAGYVSKPFDSATLMDCVEKILHTNKEVFQHGN